VVPGFLTFRCIEPTIANFYGNHIPLSQTQFPSVIRTDQVPLFAFMKVMHIVHHYSRTDVQLTIVVLPRLEDEVAMLLVEWKPRDIDRTVRYRFLIHWPPDACPIMQ